VEELESGLGKLLGGTLITPAAAAALISSLHKISASGVVKPLSGGGAEGKSAGGAADNRFIELIERTARAAAASSGGGAAAAAGSSGTGKHAHKQLDDDLGKGSSSNSSSSRVLHAGSLLEALRSQSKRVMQRDAKCSSGGGSSSSPAGSGSSGGGSCADHTRGEDASSGGMQAAHLASDRTMVSCWHFYFLGCGVTLQPGKVAKKMMISIRTPG
jgi:hypothetical protein